jgi:hypothetical protein
MIPSKNNLVLLVYFVFVVGILVFIPLSGNVDPFSFPSSVLAMNILRYDRIILPSSLPINVFWIDALSVERNYPLPSILLALFQLITGVPPDLLPFLPLSGLVTFIFYYIMILKILGELETFKLLHKEIHNVKMYYLKLVLLLLLAIHNLFDRNGSYYVGRPTLGVAFFVMMLYVIMKLFTHNKKLEWIILMMIISMASSFTYYTSTLAIFTVSLLFLLANIVRLPHYDQHTKKALFSFTIFSLFLTINQPIIHIFTSSALSFDRFISNFMAWILAQLKVERSSEAYYLAVGAVIRDPFTRISAVWIGFALRAIFILMFIFMFLVTVRRKGMMKKIILVLLIVVIGASLAELPYTFQTSTVSLRFATMTSLLFVPIVFNEIKRTRIKITLGFIILILLMLFYTGTLCDIIMYHKIYPYKYIYGFTLFISNIAQFHYNVNIVAGDSYYTGYVFFKTMLNNDRSSFYFTTLKKYALYLFNQYEEPYIIKHYVMDLVKNNIDYLIIVNDGKPVTGDPWGYAITPSRTSTNFLIQHENMLYNDKCTYLLHLLT